MSLPPDRAELIAKCPVHGRRPYDDPDRRPSSDRLSDEDVNPQRTGGGCAPARVIPVAGARRAGPAARATPSPERSGPSTRWR